MRGTRGRAVVYGVGAGENVPILMDGWGGEHEFLIPGALNPPVPLGGS